MTDAETLDYESGMKRLAMLVHRLSGRDVTEDCQGQAEPEAGRMNVCVVCGYAWASRGGQRRPQNCPSCRSTRWDQNDLFSHRCKCCGHRWVSKMIEPTRCPSCKSKLWNTDVMSYGCRSCGHRKFYPVEKVAPDACPKCSSPEWRCDSLVYTCKKCGFVGRIQTDRPSRCPVCRSTMSHDPRNLVQCPPQPIARSVDMTADAARIAMSAQNVMERTSMLMESLDIDSDSAEVIIRHMEGQDPMTISRELGVSYDKAYRISQSVDAYLKGSEGA